MDIGRELKIAINTGKVYFGVSQAKKAVRKGEAKLVIVAKNCPEKISGARVYEYPGTNVELGTVCGKPFPISAVTIVNEGESKILRLGE
ncbi:MAG: 50S ribosomal protein L30e [Thermoplasmata archaeon]|nr:MAG: 50S ribosomal protein L30e [Thermoplasmata archaeon]